MVEEIVAGGRLPSASPLSARPRRRRPTALSRIAQLALCSGACLTSSGLQAQLSLPEFKAVNDQKVNIVTAADYNIGRGTLDISEPIVSMSGGENEIHYIRYFTKMGGWRDNFKYLVDPSEPSNISVVLGDDLHVFATMYPPTNIGGVDHYGDGQGNGFRAVTIDGVIYWRYFGRDGMTADFDINTNVVTSVKYPSGLTRTYYYRTISAPNNLAGVDVRIQSIVQNDGTQIKFTYGSDNPALGVGAWHFVAGVALINQAYAYCDPSADSCGFSLSNWPSATFTGPVAGVAPSGQTVVETVTTSTGFGKSYKKDMYGRIIGISNRHNYSEDLSITYNGTSYGVNSIINNRGDVRNYSGVTYNSQTGVYTAPISSSFLGASETYQFDWNAGMGMPTKIIDRTGQPTLYAWNIPDRHIAKITHPEGNFESYQYDSRYNIKLKTIAPKPGSGLASLTEQANYDVSCMNIATCNMPNSLVDAKNNQTDFTYTAFGRKASELGPAPLPGAARPLKLYTYVQKPAYVLNGSGVLASTGQPIWKLSTETTCQTAAGSSVLICDPAAVRTDATYLYGPDGTADNLLMRGKSVSSGGVTLLTCYGYDRLRHRISTTTPNANLQVCP
ncbi:MAG: hypothetical protein QOJ91_3046 [Sphingomonadales bacterium]|jgi:hypothetical protein|nr:hypothetical protein [Sphingomonadales bacterium]